MLRAGQSGHGQGADIQIMAGEAIGTGESTIPGGSVTVSGGSSSGTNAKGGDVGVVAGNGGSSGGDVEILSGLASQSHGSSGGVSIRTSDGARTGFSGIKDSSSGDVVIETGRSIGKGSAGSVRIASGGDDAASAMLPGHAATGASISITGSHATDLSDSASNFTTESRSREGGSVSI